MRLSVSLKIFAPGLLFLAGGACAAVTGLLFEGSFRVVSIIVGWWCLCGAAMQWFDLPRKSGVYRRLLPQRDAIRRGRVPPGMRDTLCGLCILWALHDEPRVTGSSVRQYEG